MFCRMDNQKILNEFCYYFSRYFEEQLRYWRYILEEHPDLKKKSTSKPVTILSSLSAAIPTVGKAIGSGIVQGEQYINSHTDKNKAAYMADMAYSSNDERDLFRDNLIDGAFTVFCCYEYQFSKVTCNKGGATRAMQKLGQDASHRLFTYLLKDESVKAITSDVIGKGILNGESRRHNSKIIKLGRTLHVLESETKLTTSEFFSNTGIRLKNEDVFTYYSKQKSTPILGHRLIFSFENPDDVKKNYYVDSPTYFHNYSLTSANRNEIINQIRLYIIKKDPLQDIKEFVKFNFEEQVKLLETASSERQELQEKLLEDNQVKHKDTKDTIESSQLAIMNHLEIVLTENTNLILSKTEEIIQQNAEISKEIEVLKDKGEQRQSVGKGDKVVIISMEGILAQGKRLEENIKMEARKVEKEAQRFNDRIRKIRF